MTTLRWLVLVITGIGVAMVFYASVLKTCLEETGDYRGCAGDIYVVRGNP